MTQDAPLTFLEHPILNSPYGYPDRHWELDADGQPTNVLIASRRRSDLVTPVPKAKKRKAPRGSTTQVELDLTAEDASEPALDFETFHDTLATKLA